MIDERNNLIKWAKDNPGKSLVAVEGAILSGNVIIGKHSEYTVEKMVRHARISEILFKTDDGNGDRTTYQMKVGNF